MKVGREAHYQRVNRLETQGRLLEAAALLREMTEEHADERSYVQLGRYTCQDAGLRRSRVCVWLAAIAAPHSIDAYYYLSVVLFKEGDRLQKARDDNAATGKFRAAVEAGRKATELKPDHGMAYLYTGCANWSNSDDVPKRSADSERPCAVGPRLSISSWRWGRCLWRTANGTRLWSISTAPPTWPNRAIRGRARRWPRSATATSGNEHSPAHGYVA